MIAGRGADEGLLVGPVGDDLAQEVEGAADLVGADRRQVLALEIDLCAVAGAQMFVELQRGRGEKLPQSIDRGLYVHLRHVVHPLNFDLAPAMA
ncbi:hypothetical protein D3C72_1940100 [compost metagenome]